MGAGRFVCVALPFGLTVASLICLLITLLAGITNKNLDMFEVTPKNMSISSDALTNIANAATKRDIGLGASISSALNGDSSANFTASSFNLADTYKVYLWNYCSQTGEKTNCTKAKFDWASESLNVTAINEKASAISMASTGKTATLPKDVTTALKAFVKVSKWTQVVYIIAFILTVLTLITGLFGFCSRGGSCITYFVSGLATTAIIIASTMATVSSAVVVGAVKTTSKAYGVKAKLMTPFLSITWLAAAFSIGAGLFWLFTICCCKSESRGNKRNSEKFAPSSYQPLHDNNTAYQGQQQGVYNPQAHQPARGAGYEPYSHSAV
ncbi:integral membrane protein [Bisporella sp. PMI_857]|nr:integral membrane protein [Bisporella sp. PMI_857]